ncbi:MAG: DUF4153 domain-containing protein [Gemmatimonadota bacterium]
MRLPSVERMLAGAADAWRRFPLLLLCAVVAALAASIWVDSGDGRFWWHLMASATLGLPLFVALVPFAERRGWPPVRVWLLRGLGVALLVACFFAWSRWSDAVALIRYFQLSAGLHLLVAFLPWLGIDDRNGFWQYNRALFLRFLLAALYAAVLFVGLAIALAGIDNLLGVDVDGEWYARLWFVIAFLFTTWFFAAGFPTDLRALEARTDYPGGLRVFAQFVLVPLVVVYLLILTAYLGKVLVTRTWPSGWIGYLVSALATLGILALLLVHPERRRADRRWIERYARGFWIAILPSVAMLLLAIWKRIDQYGLTERRYLLGILALWLAAAAIGYAVTGSDRIRRIPQTLTLLAFVTFLGPWSAYSVSEASQRARLRGLLEAHGMFVDGRVRPATTPPPLTARREMTGALRYLIEHHGTASLDPWFDGALARIDTVADGTGPARRGEAYERTNRVLRHLGVEPWVGPLPDEQEWVRMAAALPERGRAIGSFDLVLPQAALAGDTFTVGSDTLALALRGAGTVLALTRNGDPLIEVRLDSLLAVASRASPLPARGIDPEALRIEARNDRVALSLWIESLNARRREGRLRLESGHGDLYLRVLELP